MTGEFGQFCSDGHRELKCLRIEHGFGGTALCPNSPGVVGLMSHGPLLWMVRY